MKLLGHDFGAVPFGTHQIRAFHRRQRCTCDPAFVDVAHDIDCPTHGLTATLQELKARCV